jgi:protein-tyrosine kinase
MDSFVNALARSQEASWPAIKTLPTTEGPQLKVSDGVLSLSPQLLKASRIVSFDAADGISRNFDVLRNLCTKDLAPREPDCAIIGVTSPSPGCGTSTTAINLALSLARLQKGAVLIADLMPGGQGWWRQLGLDRTELSSGELKDMIVPLEVADSKIYAAGIRSLVDGKPGGELMDAFRAWAASAKRSLGPLTIVVDLPPLLTDDRSAPFISAMDMIVLVLATGKSTTSELETCKSYLHGAAGVQLVLNKARDYDL